MLSSTLASRSTTRRFYTFSAKHRTHLVFGANTDVGKTIVTTGLVQASLRQSDSSVHYIKPLQSGGDDAGFVKRHSNNIQDVSLTCTTLFEWKTPASPHFASRLENLPLNDDDLHTSLEKSVQEYIKSTSSGNNTVTYIESAGGPLSPAAASPNHTSPHHAIGIDDKWGWQTQADLYQPLIGIAPVVLVGDGRLGGIHATLSTMESLLIRGYDIKAIVMINQDDSTTSNTEALKEYVQRKLSLQSGNGEKLFANDIDSSIIGLPPIPSDINVPLHDWFIDETVQQGFDRVEQYLRHSWQDHVADTQALKSVGRDVLWWPFTQHGQVDSDDKVTLIDSAHGDYYRVLSKERSDDDSGTDSLTSKPLFDACASWWTQGVGHGQSSMSLATAAAAGRYGHVLFPDVVHAPAVQLAQALLGKGGPGHNWADRVFWSDDGSTAVEVAIKMGIKTFQKRINEMDNEKYNWVVCGQEDCYHGDTLGVMDVSEPSIFNEGQHPWYEPKGLILPTPTLGFHDGRLKLTFPEVHEPTPDTVDEFDTIAKAMDVTDRMLTSRKLFSQYKEVIELQWLVFEHRNVREKIASVVIEPILLGAGGMKFVDPLWQRALMEIAESRNVPVIFDEVASGLYRVGVASCREILQKDPDIACYAKLLTGGLLPMSVTMATNEVFETFLGDEKGQALLHGHSYTANPIGCASALHALETYNAVLDTNNKTKRRSIHNPGPHMWFDEEQVKDLSKLPLVQQSFTLGTVLAVTIETEDGASGYGASSRTVPLVRELRQRGVFARPLGNVIYIMASPLTSKEECQRLTSILESTIRDF